MPLKFKPIATHHTHVDPPTSSEAGMADPEASGRRVRRHTETPTVLTAAAESFRASEGAYERVCDNFRLLRRK